ncbi:HAMP domain-containing sensor histidine kinase [soil metagenome]
MRLSLRYQILLPMLLLVLGIAGLGTWAAVHAVQKAIRNQIEAQLAQVVRTISDASFPFSERVLAQLKDLTGAEFVLISADGRRQSTFKNASPALPLADLPPADHHNMELGSSVTIEGQNYLSTQAPLKRPESSAPGRLFIFYPEWRWRLALWQALQPVLYLGLFGSIAAVAVTVTAAEWLTRRIRALELQTRSIAQGNFHPLPLPPFNDELRDLAASINSMADQLVRWQDAVHKTERLRLLEQVSGGLAHQLRNGVAGARLAVQVHARSCPAPEDREILDVALRQLALMEEKIQRLLQAGRDEPAMLVPCSLKQVLEDAIALMRPQCHHRRIDLRAHLTGTGVDLLADAGQLGHLFVNVLGNAAEAIGSAGWIEVRSRLVKKAEVPTGGGKSPMKSWHTIEIIDSGPGPAPSVASHLFEEFVTSKPEGVGLGLAVARQVAKAHGGSIEWERLDNATTFRIWLPMLES